MVEVRKSGDLFDCGAHAIVNTVNCVGVMGKGIALEFKKRYPAMFTEYAKLCRRKYIHTGTMWVWHEIPLCACGHAQEAHSGHTVQIEPGDKYLIFPKPVPDFCSQCIGGCQHWTPVNEYIINFPTKEDWRNPSKLEWIAAGLDDLREHAKMDYNIRSLAMPALGCSNGGLNFVDVEALVRDKLQELDINVILFEPQ
jgi:O-acetyl-ADP-ribose deacetylase (regulator of RNase III)